MVITMGRPISKLAAIWKTHWSIYGHLNGNGARCSNIDAFDERGYPHITSAARNPFVVKDYEKGPFFIEYLPYESLYIFSVYLDKIRFVSTLNTFIAGGNVLIHL